jgi:hypothetical protein
MEEVDWVRARSKCSVAGVFDALKNEVAKDVDTQNSLQGHSHFAVKHHEGSFTVIEGDGGSGRAVVFALSGNSIQIKTSERSVVLKATITLNEEGRCVLKVGQELESWQFRRRALEGLFFG